MSQLYRYSVFLQVTEAEAVCAVCDTSALNLPSNDVSEKRNWASIWLLSRLANPHRMPLAKV